MCDNDLLNNILYALETEKYEPGGIFTFGGGNGTYVLKAPFNSECEYCIVSVSTSVGTPVPYSISQSNPATLAPNVNSSLGNITNGSEGNALEGVAGYVSASSPFSSQVWHPLGRGVILYMNTNPGANQVILANIAFRRLYAHVIPDAQIRHLAPPTHSRPYSRRTVRVVPGVSKQMAGFASQYPTREDGKETYEHEDIPWEQDPRGGLVGVLGLRRGAR